MGELVSLAEERLKHAPHIAGEAICMKCNHRWSAVFPVGVIALECPECKMQKGVLDKFINSSGPRLVCNSCDGDLFMIDPTSPVCVMCGDRSHWLPLVPTEVK